MRIITAFRGRLRERLDHAAAQERMDEEFRFHIVAETEKNLRAGMDPLEARRRALLAFGGVERHREALREGRSIPLFDDLTDDLGQALRSLFRHRAFAVVSILTIGLAIGAATAIFSVVDGVLLRLLPYPDPDELVSVRLEVDMNDIEDMSFSDRGFWHFHDGNRSFEHFGGFTTVRLPLVGSGEPIQVGAGLMTVGAFEAIGVQPLLGRLPKPEEELSGAPRIVLISEGLWRGRFSGDTAIVGRTIDLGLDFEVIGVMPADYDFPSPTIDIWYPYRLNRASENWGGHHIRTVARLRDGVSIDDARSDAAGLIRRFGEAGYDSEWLTDVFTGGATIRTLTEGRVGASRRPLYTVLGTVGFVLLIACGNVANLLLARGESRSRETAMRKALGASRGRLVKDIFLESLTIATLGGLLGLLLAHAGTRILVAIGPTAIPRLDEIRTSPNVLAFVSAVVIGAALLAGMFPAFRVASRHWMDTLRDAGRGATIGKDRHRARGSLVIAQVALTVVLLIGSGLLVRSVYRLRAVDPGFRPEGVLTFGVNLPGSRYPEMESISRFMGELFERLEALPGVAAAAGINTLPLTDGGASAELQVEGHPVAAGDIAPVFKFRRVTPGYFAAMGIPVIEGRAFENKDHEEMLGTAIVSASLKDEYWPETSALGRHLDLSTVVGVVGDVHDGSLTSVPERLVYFPMIDGIMGTSRSWMVVVRTAADSPGVTALVRQEVARMDPALPIYQVQTMADVVSASMGRVTFTMTLLLLAAFLALFLGSVGIYGVISCVVTQRTAEMGIRRALGAERTQVWGMVMRDAMLLALTGTLLGLFAAAAMADSLSTLVYGIGRFDSFSFVGGAVVLLIVAAAASCLPAVRGVRIEPSVALRGD